MDLSTRLQRTATAALVAAPWWIAKPLRIAWQAAVRWVSADAPQLGASISFYTVFALAPLLIITIAVAGLVFGEEAARGQIVGQIQGLVGQRAAEAIEGMILSSANDGHGTLATLLGTATILIGATGVFAELRRALNALAEARPEGSAIGAFVRARLIAVALLLGLGFLVIASLVLSATLAGISGYLSGALPGLQYLFATLDIVVSAAVLGTAFAALLRWMPDRPPSWRGVWIGALTAAVLFSVGKSFIGLYLGRATVTSSFGAAASFAVVLLWTWYSAQILLFGASVGLAYDAQRSPRRFPDPSHPPEAARSRAR